MAAGQNGNRRDEALQRIASGAERLRTSDGWQAWLKVAARFHRYSFNNTVLIWMQRPDATRVAGFTSWQHMGRQVLKGSKAIWILAPMTKKDHDGETEVVGFKPVPVFAFEDTDDDGSGRWVDEPEWPMPAGGDVFVLHELCRRVEANDGRRIVFLDETADPTLAGGARGYFRRSTGVIVVRADMPAAAQLRTLLHELGHAHDPDIERDGDRVSRELVAESAGWIAGERIGLAADDATEFYLANWGDDIDSQLKGLAKRIFAAVDGIEAAIADTNGQVAA